MIAHRLATVKKADNIIVLKKGKLIQQGTHEDLMKQEGGAYRILATAQQLVAATDDEAENDQGARFPDPEVTEKKSTATMGTETTLVETTIDASPGETNEKTRGFWGSFWLLLFEQRGRWRWYVVLVASAVCGGGKHLRAAFDYQAFSYECVLTRFDVHHTLQQASQSRPTYSPPS